MFVPEPILFVSGLPGVDAGGPVRKASSTVYPLESQAGSFQKVFEGTMEKTADSTDAPAAREGKGLPSFVGEASDLLQMISQVADFHGIKSGVGGALDAIEIDAIEVGEELRFLPLQGMVLREGMTLQSSTAGGLLHAAESIRHDPSFAYEVIRQMAQALSLKRLDRTPWGEGVTLELEPKELGLLKINLVVHKGSLSADIITQHASVKEMLEKNHPLLHDALAGAGFQVNHFSVNVGNFKDRREGPFYLEVPPGVGRGEAARGEGLLLTDERDRKISLYI